MQIHTHPCRHNAGDFDSLLAVRRRFCLPAPSRLVSPGALAGTSFSRSGQTLEQTCSRWSALMCRYSFTWTHKHTHRDLSQPGVGRQLRESGIAIVKIKSVPDIFWYMFGLAFALIGRRSNRPHRHTFKSS